MGREASTVRFRTVEAFFVSIADRPKSRKGSIGLVRKIKLLPATPARVIRHFAGLTIEEAARALGLSTTTAHRYWTYARARLHQAILSDKPSGQGGAASREI